MTTDRSYRKALPLAEAVAEVERCAGSQFDPTVVTALVEVVTPDAAEPAELRDTSSLAG